MRAGKNIENKKSVVTKVKWVILHCGHTPEVGQSKQANGD